MKILLLTDALNLGGAERLIATLCNAWVARGESITSILTYSGGGGEPFYKISEMVELIYLADVVGVKNKNLFTYAERIYALRRLIAQRSPDVIVSFFPHVNVAAVVSSALLRIPVIICEVTDPSMDPRHNYLNALCKLTYRFADMLAVKTDSVAGKVRRLYPGLKIVRSIPNPLPTGVIEQERTRGGRRKTLLSLGRLAPEKQINRLLSAFAEVAPSFDDWDLHIYGDGPLKSALEKQIEELGLQGRGVLMGLTSDPWKVMAEADAFAMTSQYEGFPNALLEAMGIGLPCVVFDCQSGPREITRNGKDALLIRLNDHAALVDALSKLMANEELRRSLGEQARESVCSRFGLREVIKSWDRLFKDVGALQ